MQSPILHSTVPFSLPVEILMQLFRALREGALLYMEDIKQFN
jgi:hypothetical protein